jgi:predicted nucleotidyltransferase
MQAPSDIRRILHQRSRRHHKDLLAEVERLTTEAAALGVKRVVLFGSLTQGEPRLSSDIDLLMVWDTKLNFLERTVELYRRLQPRAALDLLVYTPEEMTYMAHTPLVKRALMEGKTLYAA